MNQTDRDGERGMASEVAVDDVVELTVPAQLGRVPIVRSLVENVLLTDDFSLDTVADLKVGVDEACGELIARTSPSARLKVIIATAPQDVRIEICCEVGSDVLDEMSFGWYVIKCVTDDVTVTYIDGDRRREAQIVLTALRS
ncbi:anti-sigma factor [Gordonia sp. CPCC 205333]|uniref:anti-sigma factor n=1 Tax=Gordonia sp. CPCC 205333 TaxID=3140790 RepID=UPI003AF36DE8